MLERKWRHDISNIVVPVLILFIAMFINMAAGRISFSSSPDVRLRQSVRGEIPVRFSALDMYRVRRALRWRGHAKMIARRFGRDWRDIIAQIAIESSGDHRAVSLSRAQGLMQVKRSTLEGDIGRPELNLFHPWEGVWAGVRYMNMLRDRYGYQSLHEQLVAYHDGPGENGAQKFLARHAPEEHFYVRRFLRARAALDDILR